MSLSESVPVARSAAERWQCRHCGISSSPLWREGPMGRRMLCNACGIQYRAGRLLPEYRPARSPTFSSELHSNRHHRIVQLCRVRREAVQNSLAAAGYGREGGQEVERPSSKSVFLAVDTMAPAGQRPRSKGSQRPRRVLAGSPPPPPRASAQGRVPGGGPDRGRATRGGVEATAPRALGVARPWRSQGGRDGMGVEQRRVPGGGDDGVGGDAAADGGAADKGRAPAAAAPSVGGVDYTARAAAAAAALQAPVQRWCQHCGTVMTPQWREGPDGKRTLCNACGLWYRKSGGLVPQYRPASSRTFSPTLHSNHRNVVQRLSASPVVTTAIAAAGEAGDK